MSLRSLAVLISIWLGTATFAGYQGHVFFQQRGQKDALVERSRHLATEASALRRDRDATLRELARAEQQLASLPIPRSKDPTITPSQRTEIKAWLARVRQLRQLLDEKPNQRIPELALLTNDDWLRTGKSFRIGTDEENRRALADLRSLAIRHFTPRISAAMRRYMGTTSGEKPATIQVLAGYFDSPVDLPMLERYEITDPPAQPLPGNPRWGVQLRTPADPDYDFRFRIFPPNLTGNSGPLGWVPGLAERYERAETEYIRANQGDRPPNAAATLPFFHPPLDPELAERLIRTNPR